MSLHLTSICFFGKQYLLNVTRMIEQQAPSEPELKTMAQDVLRCASLLQMVPAGSQPPTSGGMVPVLEELARTLALGSAEDQGPTAIETSGVYIELQPLTQGPTELRLGSEIGLAVLRGKVSRGAISMTAMASGSFFVSDETSLGPAMAVTLHDLAGNPQTLAGTADLVFPASLHGPSRDALVAKILRRYPGLLPRDILALSIFASNSTMYVQL